MFGNDIILNLAWKLPMIFQKNYYEHSMIDKIFKLIWFFKINLTLSLYIMWIKNQSDMMSFFKMKIFHTQKMMLNIIDHSRTDLNLRLSRISNVAIFYQVFYDFELDSLQFFWINFQVFLVFGQHLKKHSIVSSLQNILFKDSLHLYLTLCRSKHNF